MKNLTEEQYKSQIEIAVYELIKLPDLGIKEFIIQVLRESVNLRYPKAPKQRLVESKELEGELYPNITD